MGEILRDPTREGGTGNRAPPPAGSLSERGGAFVGSLPKWRRRGDRCVDESQRKGERGNNEGNRRWRRTVQEATSVPPKKKGKEKRDQDEIFFPGIEGGGEQLGDEAIARREEDAFSPRKKEDEKFLVWGKEALTLNSPTGLGRDEGYRLRLYIGRGGGGALNSTPLVKEKKQKTSPLLLTSALQKKEEKRYLSNKKGFNPVTREKLHTLLLEGKKGMLAQRHDPAV